MAFHTFLQVLQVVWHLEQQLVNWSTLKFVLIGYLRKGRDCIIGPVNVHLQDGFQSWQGQQLPQHRLCWGNWFSSCSWRWLGSCICHLNVSVNSVRAV
jgi:hypothetical protein